jgi:hypothetical protein
MKKPTSLDDYKAYAFGITWVILTLLAPFAILKAFTYVF